jgi:hypothetical protein
MKGRQAMAQQHAARPQPPEQADPLEEIYRRLVSIHHALATDLDGGAELQARMRHRVKDLLDYVGEKLDARDAARSTSGTHAIDAGPLTSSSSRESRREPEIGQSARPRN